MNKLCPGCEIEKVIERFSFKNKVKGTRQPYCDDCRRVRAKTSYTKHRSATIKAVTARNRLMVERFQLFKKTLKCELCPETESVCLDFHHLDPSQKDFVVSEMVAKVGWDKLMEEINKCAVLCANCHRKVHAYILTLPR